MSRPNDTHATRIRSNGSHHDDPRVGKHEPYRREDPQLVAEMLRIARQDREQANQTTKEES